MPTLFLACRAEVPFSTSKMERPCWSSLFWNVRNIHVNPTASNYWVAHAYVSRQFGTNPFVPWSLLANTPWQVTWWMHYVIRIIIVPSEIVMFFVYFKSETTMVCISESAEDVTRAIQSFMILIQQVREASLPVRPSEDRRLGGDCRNL